VNLVKHIFYALAALLCVAGLLSATAVASQGEIVNSKGEAPIKNKYTGTMGASTLETVAGVQIVCSSASIKGEIKSKVEGERAVVYTGCKSEGKACTSEGEPSGTVSTIFTYKWIWIVIIPIYYESSYLPAVYPKGVFTLKCGTVTVELQGAFLVPMGEAQEGKLKKSYTFVARQEKGLQSPFEYENESKGKTKVTLESSFGGASFEQSGIHFEESVTFEEEVEIKK
jgi:hypothetical protein